MQTPSEESLAATAAEAEPLRRLQAFARWVGAGRKLTQTGRKKHAGLLGRPLQLWARMFEAFPRLNASCELVRRAVDNGHGHHS